MKTVWGQPHGGSNPSASAKTKAASIADAAFVLQEPHALEPADPLEIDMLAWMISRSKLNVISSTGLQEIDTVQSYEHSKFMFFKAFIRRGAKKKNRRRLSEFCPFLSTRYYHFVLNYSNAKIHLKNTIFEKN